MAKPTLLFIFVAVIFCGTTILFSQEQAPAPVHKGGDTWQFNICRKGQTRSSTEQNEGMYELSFNQGAIKLYDINGGQKSEIPIKPDGPTQALLRLVAKSDDRPDLKFPLSVGQKWSY
jgi:hypothetical protein